MGSSLYTVMLAKTIYSVFHNEELEVLGGRGGGGKGCGCNRLYRDLTSSVFHNMTLVTHSVHGNHSITVLALDGWTV